MMKTEFYIAGGTKYQPSIKIADCTKILEVEGVLYDFDGKASKFLWDKETQIYLERVVIKCSDRIGPEGITRRIIFNN